MFKLSKQTLTGMLFLLLLISCKTIAFQNTSSNEFNTSLQKAELLIDSDPKSALMVLNSYQNDVHSQSLTSQVDYYRIQSKAYLDQALYTLSLASADMGLKLTKQMNSPSILIAELAFTKGYALESLGDLDGAFQLYQNGLDVARSMSHQKLIARGFINIGAIYYLSKNYKQSLICLNQALQIANNIKDEALMGSITSELGILYSYLNKKEQVSDFFLQSYQHYKKAGKHNYALDNLYNVAITHASQKKYDQAIKSYRELESELKDHTRSPFVARLYRSLASAFINKENADVENAYRYIQLAEEYIKDVEQHVVKLQYRITKAQILEKMGRYQEAFANIEQAEILFEENVSGTYDNSKLRMLNLKAKLYYNLEQYDQAYSIQQKYFTKAIANRESHDIAEIDELRLQYEIETSERQRSILEQRQSIQNIQLHQLTQESNNRKLFSILLIVCVLVLLLALYKVIRGQQDVINAKHTDGLTGVINRRRVFQIGYRYFKEAQVQQKPLSVCVIDIDYFKEINDELDHYIGDNVLQQIAIYGQEQMRESDILGRFDSKQFIALLPFTEYAEAFEVAQRIKENIEKVKWHEQGLILPTVSVGLSTYEQKKFDNFNALAKAASEQLLQIKNTVHIKAM